MRSKVTRAGMSAALAATSLLSCATAFAAGPAGVWYTPDNRAQVRIAPCGRNALCGDIVWLKEPNDPQSGKPKTDFNNSDAARRGRPLIGLSIFAGLARAASSAVWRGQIYNPDDGHTYSGSLTMTGANVLELKGCVLGGIICKAQNWTRARKAE